MPGSELRARGVQALVADFGGVLTNPLPEAMAAFAEDAGIELPDLVCLALGAYAGSEDDLVTRFETGYLPEDEFAAQLASRIEDEIGVDIPRENLVERMFAGLKLEERMFEAIEAVRGAGYRTALLSNSWGRSLYPRASLDGLFNVIVVSGEVGLRKPDPEIFRVTIDRLGVAAARCVFVDDHPEHLEAALQVGMKPVLHRSVDETLAELEALLEIPLRSRGGALRGLGDGR